MRRDRARRGVRMLAVDPDRQEIIEARPGTNPPPHYQRHTRRRPLSPCARERCRMELADDGVRRCRRCGREEELA